MPQRVVALQQRALAGPRQTQEGSAGWPEGSAGQRQQQPGTLLAPPPAARLLLMRVGALRLRPPIRQPWARYL